MRKVRDGFIQTFLVNSLVNLCTWLNHNQIAWIPPISAILYFSVGLDLGNKIASDSFYEERRIKTYTLNPNRNPNPNRNRNPNPNPLKWIQRY